MARFKPVAIELKEDFFSSYNLKPGPVLGRGMSGEVVLVTSPTNPSQKRAVKKLSLLTRDGGIRNLRLFANEIGAIQGLSHPHVIKHVLSARCPEYLVICTEYCPNGTLSSKLQDMTPRSCTLYFLQMACAVRYLNQRQGLVHNDIKPGNIFISDKHEPVLGDFGLSFLILPNDTVVPTCGMGGTPGYCAPEKLTCSHVDPYKLDVYSLGVVLLCMLVKHESASVHVEDCLRDSSFILSLSEPLRWCLLSTLQADPTKRPPVTDLLDTLSAVGLFTDLIDKL